MIRVPECPAFLPLPSYSSTPRLLFSPSLVFLDSSRAFLRRLIFLNSLPCFSLFSHNSSTPHLLFSPVPCIHRLLTCYSPVPHIHRLLTYFSPPSLTFLSPYFFLFYPVYSLSSLRYPFHLPLIFLPSFPLSTSFTSTSTSKSTVVISSKRC